MLFNSFIFVLLFLPVAVTGYFILNAHKRYTLAKWFIICMSLWFYGYYEWKYLVFIVADIFANYLIYRLLIKGRCVKPLLVLGIAANIGALAFYKYSPREILIPLALSFITFQQISFLVDAYREELGYINFEDYCFYISFFPKLLSGPIILSKDFFTQTDAPNRMTVNWGNIYTGIWLFVLGMAKKVLLADVLAKAVDFGFSMFMYVDGFSTFMAVILYSFQLLFDFSGYCDMARGIGYMFNIDIPVNFLSPYKATNVSDFWERWHITLTKFFTKYLYIPLGGSRRGTVRTYINIMIVFLVSGAWHGDGITFIIWGAFHGIGSICSRIINMNRKSHNFKGISNVLSVILTFLYVSFAWLFFRADSLISAIEMIRHIVSGGISFVCREMTDYFMPSIVGYGANYLKMNVSIVSAVCFLVYFAICIYLAFFSKSLCEMEKSVAPTVKKTVALAALLVICMVNFSEVSQFLYFDF